MTVNSRIPQFYKLSPAERLKTVLETCGIKDEDLTRIGRTDAEMLSIADHMIENVVATLPVPLGIAANFTVNGRDYLVPMATEEPSVVAAASNMAGVARLKGGFTTSSSQPIMIAQVQVVDVQDPFGARLRLFERRQDLLDLANAQDAFLVKVGGGAKDIQVRIVDAGARTFVVLHLIVDVRDAMGANAVNTMAEALAPLVAEITGGRVRLRILSNKADMRLARVRATYDRDALGGADVVDGILDAYAFAAADPYRAATHNKGIMNGVTAVVLATGNDTRAVEAGAHSHAAAGGRYTSLSHYEKDADGNLVGTMEMPMAVGLVGGATKTHPVAQAAVKLLGVTSASELAEIIVAVGLAQNTGALRALAAEGIQKGHMSLHARNIAVTAGAKGDEIEAVTARLKAGGKVRLDTALEILAELRG
ncbi:hydroxymethylglutaryl-CoA reductase, degradative [Xanthobacter tagetidis]|jgi:hydroxymethylglutaryl-CoA reductase|uniref:3-hydroxy-3-methylglutaryl coenzyme A reductase n=1 Tax=Xanthobacter tagetidis TaxID=60216 RepID=A0A3L7AEU8_9HYPH|nr:hydroxymethylglutaryl-CoA reductase, degradative [Xanthobacter tagetidis]MBB6309812.1 hydroxymethylglutaryl-CoA reductase [Xanthobacter tagetidis]RLP78161.1 hydroxymethylglutaryl-CoA reductase, degradative [Xanthobacter tagetidis]